MAKLVYFEHPIPPGQLPGVIRLGDHSRPIDAHWMTVWVADKYRRMVKERYGVDVELYAFSDNTPNPSGQGAFSLCALYCIEERVDVLGMSRQLTNDEDNRAALEALHAAGVKVVQCVGNSYQQRRPNWPAAADPRVIGVGASDSRTGLAAEYNLPGSIILAPGDRPDMPIPQSPGNSFAAPEVAVFVAACCAVDPSLDWKSAIRAVTACRNKDGLLVWPDKLPGMEVEQMRKRSDSEIQYIVVHHSGTGEGNVDIFRKYHTEVNKWSDVGYHFILTNGKGGDDGEIQEGRNLIFSGAHCIPRNLDSVGVCLVGNFQNTSPTAAQMASLKKLCFDLCKRYNIKPANVLGHNECDSGTECPGDKFNVQELRDYLRSALAPSMLGKVVDDAAAVYLDGERLEKDAIIIEGTSYLPVRLLSEKLGLSVKWDPKKRIDLTTE